MTTNLWKCLRTSTAMLLALILFPNLSRTQTDNVLPKVLTLEDALNYALQHYPAVRASLEQVSAARAGVTLARTQYLPQLNGVYQVSRATQNQVNGIWLPTPITPSVEGPIGPASGQSFWNSQAAALFSWEPLDFGLRSANVAQARSAEVKSQADLALTQLQVATAVGNYFLLAVANQRVVLAAQANVDRWQVFDNPFMSLLITNCGLGRMLRVPMLNSREQNSALPSSAGRALSLDTLAPLLGAAGTEIQLDGPPTGLAADRLAVRISGVRPPVSA